MNLKIPVPKDAADARMAELLDKVRTVFAAKGFDRASMQDLAQAAGMSAGNFYRYFPSKDAIIEAMVQRDLAAIEAKFAVLMQSDDPMALLRLAVAEQMDEEDCEEGAIWAEVLAAAKRRAEVGALCERMEDIVTGHLVELFGQVNGVDPATAESRYRGHATLIFLLIQGVKMRRRQDDGFAGSPLRTLALKTLMNILDEITPAAPAAARTGTR